MIVYDDAVAPLRIDDPVFAAQIYPVTITVFVMNIACTWYLTTCICFKLWSTERRARAIEDYEVHTRGGSYGRIIWVLIQSGMLKSVTELIFLFCIVGSSDNGSNFMSDMDGRIIGIVTTLIVLQLNHSGSENNTTIHSTHRSRTGTGTVGTYNVRVTKHTHTHTHTDVKSSIPNEDEPSDDVEMTPVTKDDDPIKSND
ncbi:hypothetical protein FRB94_007370 [Tulasnella sp. JGI-2019a]|nr:hypothetical protein FRB94_007370 [Tulasnella sp. JGI-2019a]